MTITSDAVVNILAGADTPLSSVAVAKSLKTSQTRKVVSVLTDLVRDETLERIGSQYRLRDAGSHDVPGYSTSTPRTLLPTDTQAIKAGERRKAVAKLASSRKDRPASDDIPPNQLAIQPPDKKTAQKPAQEVSKLLNGTIPVDKSHENTVKPVDNPVTHEYPFLPPVTTLEQVKETVDEKKARDQRIRDAVDRLKRKASVTEPVTMLEFKVEVLNGIGSVDEDLWDVMSEIVRDLRRLDALTG